ncbi:MAG: hypothetical protein U1E25_12505 [Methylocystis sp.]
MRTTLAALLCLCVGAAEARAEELREEDGKERVQRAGKRRDKEESGATERNKERKKERSSEQNRARSQVEPRGAAAPNAQTLGRDQSGVYVNAPATNSAFSPEFVMRGFSRRRHAL